MEEDEEESEVCETSECDRDQSASSDDIILKTFLTRTFL